MVRFSLMFSDTICVLNLFVVLILKLIAICDEYGYDTGLYLGAGALKADPQSLKSFMLRAWHLWLIFLSHQLTLRQ